MEEVGFRYELFKTLNTNEPVHPLKYHVRTEKYGDLSYTAKIIKYNTDFVAISFDNIIKSDQETEDGKFCKEYNLKFHINLPEADKDTGENSIYSRGWKIISDILIRNRIVFFKIIKPGIKMSDKEEQRGKDITIYAKNNPDKSINDWQCIFKEITQKLTESNIPPGYRPISSDGKEEKYLIGNNYVSYRYEGKEEDVDNGLSGRNKKWHKGIKYPGVDKLSGISVEVENQLPNTEWNPIKNDPLATGINLINK